MDNVTLRAAQTFTPMFSLRQNAAPMKKQPKNV